MNSRWFKVALGASIALSASCRAIHPNGQNAALRDDSLTPGETRPVKLRASGRHFLDEQGRAVILRSINVGADGKMPPYMTYTPEDLEALPGLGFNSVRLLFVWEAYEPVRDQINKQYLDWLVSIARKADELGLYVVIDFHQDGFSRYSAQGCGSGFPVWALASKPATPDNGEGCKAWGLYMTLDASMHLQDWKHFFADTHGVRLKFIQTWRDITRAFRGIPSVIGYDIINEPWGDEATELAPLYSDVGRSIRALDPDSILFIEPWIAVGMADMPEAARSGFTNWMANKLGLDKRPTLTRTNLPRPNLDNIVYAPHLYLMSSLINESFDGNTSVLADTLDRAVATANSWNVPVWIGEFGIPGQLKAKSPKTSLDFMNALYDLFNERSLSGAQWNYTPGWTPERRDGWNTEDLSIIDGQGQPRPSFRRRPVAQKIGGVPLQITDRVASADAKRSESFELKWIGMPAKGVTEVYAPRDIFVGGDVKVTSDPETSCEYDPALSWKLVCAPVGTGQGNRWIKIVGVATAAARP